MHGPGHPVVHSGNIALTFEVVVDGQTYGIRCFHRPSDSLQVRYEAISDYLRPIASPYFVDFEFQPSGITTEDGTYPVVRMEWAEGETLAAFVARQRNDADVLQHLRASLRDLARHLDAHGIAHGDIQPTNIIVQAAGRLRLIDYDGMLVPALSGTRSTELGQPNFQHPKRRAWHFNAGLDAFSFALIDVALDALCRKPCLWDQTGSDEDAFLWRAADLENPAGSPVFRVLASVPGLEQRVKQLAAVSVSPFERIPTFEDFLAARNIPDVSVVFTGDATLPATRRYVPSNDIVDANNFAKCCTYVGHRVELIGQIVRVVVDGDSRLDAKCVRVEFAAHSHDMVCLKIWPDAIARLAHVPDQAWIGQWVSAIGLVDPVHSNGSGPQRRKDVAISIMEQSQLRQLTEADALDRLGALRGPTGPSSDTTAGVRTVPVGMTQTPSQDQSEPESLREFYFTPEPGLEPTPPPPAADAGSGPTRGGAAPARPARWPWWVAATLIASIVAYAIYPTQATREHDPSARLADEIRSPGPSPQSPTPSAKRDERGRLASQQDLDAAPGAIATAAGTLLVGTAADEGPASVVLLDGDPIPGLRDDVIKLVHRAVFSDREVIVGFTQCNGPAPPCGRKAPFWLELRAGSPAELRRKPDLWTGSGEGSVTATDAGVQVVLGLWDGERRTATLTPAGNIVVSREREPIGRLDRADCATVMQAVEACRASRDCSTLESSAKRISRSQRTQLARMYHESTGLDAAAFRGLCVRSCELGWTPSPGYVRRYVCNGAQPDQWFASDSTAGPL